MRRCGSECADYAARPKYRKLVGIEWVEKCYKERSYVDETLYKIKL